MRYIYKNENKMILLINLLIFTFLLVCLYYLGLFPATSVLLPYSAIVAILSYVRYHLPVKISYLLFSCQLDDYEDYIQHIKMKVSKKSSLQNYYLFRIAQYSYYLGDFEDCIQTLKQVEVEGLSLKKYGAFDKLDYYLLAYRSRIELGGEKQIRNIALQLCSQTKSNKKDLYLKKIQLYEDLIVRNQVNDYCNFLSEDSILKKIEKNYFIAKNSILKKDFESTKIHFENIVQYDGRLFMVREAKKWLANIG